MNSVFYHSDEKAMKRSIAWNGLKKIDSFGEGRMSKMYLLSLLLFMFSFALLSFVLLLFLFIRFLLELFNQKFYYFFMIA